MLDVDVVVVLGDLVRVGKTNQQKGQKKINTYGIC